VSSSGVSVLHGLHELPGTPVYVAYRYRIKNIPPDLGTHCKPIHDALQLHTPCRYRQRRPFQPPGRQRLWSHRKSYFTEPLLLMIFVFCAYTWRIEPEK
jgi:hypothetical protein